ncbi:MAG: hypothetical protein KDE19_00985, partial [Caldilineaceae bacterium]|nr:hypothetical protein [Caldilineaceae bacterium]
MYLQKVVIAAILLIAATACSLPPQLSTSLDAPYQPMPDLFGYQTSTQRLDSPDGQWTAETLVAVPADNGATTLRNYYQQLTVARTDGSQQFFPIRVWSPFGLGYEYPV